MKILSVLAAIVALASPLAAQQTSSVAGSQSASGASAGAISGTTTNNTYTNQKESWVNNVPAVSAPAIFGGGHPCLAGKSGGIAIAGFGGSYGEGGPEPVCQLWFMGQPEAAIRALAATNAVACDALNNVGYYRVAGKTAPFACGEPTVKGGVYTGTKSPKARPALLSKCERRSDGKIAIAYTSLGKQNKEIAQRQCSASLK